MITWRLGAGGVGDSELTPIDRSVRALILLTAGASLISDVSWIAADISREFGADLSPAEIWIVAGSNDWVRYYVFALVALTILVLLAGLAAGRALWSAHRSSAMLEIHMPRWAGAWVCCFLLSLLLLLVEKVGYAAPWFATVALEFWEDLILFALALAVRGDIGRQQQTTS